MLWLGIIFFVSTLVLFFVGLKVAYWFDRNIVSGWPWLHYSVYFIISIVVGLDGIMFLNVLRYYVHRGF